MNTTTNLSNHSLNHRTHFLLFGFLSSALLATGVEGEQYPREIHFTTPCLSFSV